MYFLNNQYNQFMMNLLHHFSHYTCSIYWMLMTCLKIDSEIQYEILFSQWTAWSFSNIIKLLPILNDLYLPREELSDKKSNIGKHKAPFPQLIIVNIPNCFVKFVIFGNNDEFCRRYGWLKKVLHPQVYVHPHKISIHSNIISAKNTNVFIVKLLKKLFKMKWGLCYIPEPKILYMILWQKLFNAQWIL